MEDVDVFTGSRFSLRSTLTSVHRTFSLTATSIKFFKRQDKGQTSGQRDRRLCNQLVSDQRQRTESASAERDVAKTSPSRSLVQVLQDECVPLQKSCWEAAGAPVPAPIPRWWSSTRSPPQDLTQRCSGAVLHQLLRSSCSFFLFFFFSKV